MTKKVSFFASENKEVAKSFAKPKHKVKPQVPVIDNDDQESFEFKRPRRKNYLSLADGLADLEVSTELTVPDNKTRFDSTIETCIACGVKPAGIFKILNQFIIDAGIDMDFFALTTLKRRINALYASKIETHENDVNELIYIGNFLEKFDLSQPNTFLVLFCSI